MRRRAGRDAWRGWLVHQFGSHELPEPSTLPVSDVFMGYGGEARGGDGGDDGGEASGGDDRPAKERSKRKKRKSKDARRRTDAAKGR